MRIIVHTEIPEDAELHGQWNALVQSMERPEVFYTIEWALAMQTAYGSSLKPLLLLGYEGDDLVGVASLATDPIRKSLGFLAATTADYCDFLSLPEKRTEFVDATFSELQRINSASIAFANLPSDSQTSKALLNGSRSTKCHIFIRPAYACAQVDLGTGALRQALKDSLTGKKKLRRFFRQMERQGPVTFVHLKSWKQIQDALPAFVQAHVSRFEATGRTSSLSTRERRLFLEELARRFDGSGAVTLSMLKIADRPVAWNYGFQFHGSWFWYQPTFDSSQEENSPGYCLLSQIVIDACDSDGMHLVDLGLGDEGYKERFGNRVRQTLHATLTQSAAAHLGKVARYKAANIVKRSPAIESAVRRLLPDSKQ